MVVYEFQDNTAEDRHDRVRQAVDVDLNTAKSPEEFSCARRILNTILVFLSANVIPCHLAVPVLFYHTSKYLFNTWPHLAKQSELQTSSLCLYLTCILKFNIKFAKFSFPTLLNSKGSVC